MVLELIKLRACHSPKRQVLDVVYFSNVSENTKRFVDKLGFNSYRIPVNIKEAEKYTHNKESVLILPTYGGGNEDNSVPKQVIKFLNNPDNRKHIKAVIAGGNTNFGTHFCKAGEIVSKKLGVPLLYKFEITGTQEEVIECRRRIEEYGKQYVNL